MIKVTSQENLDVRLQISGEIEREVNNQIEERLRLAKSKWEQNMEAKMDKLVEIRVSQQTEQFDNEKQHALRLVSKSLREEFQDELEEMRKERDSYQEKYLSLKLTCKCNEEKEEEIVQKTDINDERREENADSIAGAAAEEEAVAGEDMDKGKEGTDEVDGTACIDEELDAPTPEADEPKAKKKNKVSFLTIYQSFASNHCCRYISLIIHLIKTSREKKSFSFI